MIWHLRVFCCCFYDHILMSKIQTDEQFHQCFHVVFECFRRKQWYILSFQMRNSISNAESSLVYEKIISNRWQNAMTLKNYILILIRLQSCNYFGSNKLEMDKRKTRNIILWKIIQCLSPIDAKWYKPIFICIKGFHSS